MKKISAFTTVLLGLLMLPACENKGGEAEEVKGDFFEIISGTSSSYAVVYPSDAEEQVIKDAASLRAAIYKATGVKLELTDDSSAPSGHEIIVGTTTRTATASAMAKFPDDYSFCISRVGDDIVIAASDEDILSYALYDFDKNVLSQKTRAKAGMLRIEEGDYKVKSLGCPLTIKHLMGTRMYYKLGVQECASSGASPDASIASTQGACSDGEYMYFAFRDNADNGAGKVTRNRSIASRVQKAPGGRGGMIRKKQQKKEEKSDEKSEEGQCNGSFCGNGSRNDRRSGSGR